MAASSNRVAAPAVLQTVPSTDEYGLVVRVASLVPAPAASTWQTSQVTVGMVAVRIATVPLPNRNAISLKASCVLNAEIFVGASNSVTVLTGTSLADRETLSLELDSNAELWAVATVAGQLLYVSEIA